MTKKVNEFRGALGKIIVNTLVVALVCVKLLPAVELSKALASKSPNSSVFGQNCQDATTDEAHGQNINSPYSITSPNITDEAFIGENLLTNNELASAVIGSAHTTRPIDTVVTKDSAIALTGEIVEPGGTTSIVITTMVRGSTFYHYQFSYTSTMQMQLSYSKVNAGDKSYVPLNLLQLRNEQQVVDGYFTTNTDTDESIELILTALNPGHVELNAMSVRPMKSGSMSKGYVTIAFDDGWNSMYTSAKPYLDIYGFKTTQFIIAKQLEKTENGYMNHREIKELYDSGHEIASHSLEHCAQSDLSVEHLREDHREAQRIFRESGYGIEGFSFPYGDFSNGVLDEIGGQYTYMRTSVDGLNDTYSDLGMLKIKSVESDTTLEEVRLWIDEARLKKTWLILLYHKIGEEGQYNSSKEQFGRQLKLIEDSGLTVSTASDVIKKEFSNR